MTAEEETEFLRQHVSRMVGFLHIDDQSDEKLGGLVKSLRLEAREMP